MHKGFYPRLAVSNIQKNRQTYAPYILSGIGTVMMYDIMFTLSKNAHIEAMSGGEAAKQILVLGTYVIAIFAAIFLFYTNSFLMKRRKKEFGLFNILGMEKKHISRIILFETLITAIITCVGGIAGGVLFSKLMELLLLKLLHMPVQLGLGICLPAILSTLLLFAVIYLLTYLNTLRQIHLVNPIDLLKGGQVGEKEPKTRWLLAAFGVGFLAVGYYISLTTEATVAVLSMFFLAVICIIIGTNLVFVSGSTAFLKLLRKNKKFYYRSKHFISISGMIYRMKQNAVGLSNICILSTIVLVMLSTTFSMYVGVEDALRNRFNRQVMLSANQLSEEQIERVEVIVEKESERYPQKAESVLRFRSRTLSVVQEGSVFQNAKKPETFEDTQTMGALIMIPLADYNRMMGQQERLAADEVLLYSVHEEVPWDQITVCGKTFSVKDRVSLLEISGKQRVYMMNSIYLIMPDIAAILAVDASQQLSYSYAFDLQGTREDQLALSEALTKELNREEPAVHIECAEASRESFYFLYGTLFFLGIFLGTLFMMATVLIIYYKQISEGYEDRERFEIMQKVGMSHAEIKQSILSQVLTVFFLPLVTAGIHVAFGFKIITKLLSLLNLTNVPLFALSTLATFLVFGIFYVVIYAVTARVYYKIVS